jgi:sulfate adenylyltransferase subunit 2
VWQYIYLEKIPLPDLYLAKMRPVVTRNGVLIHPNDDRFQLHEGETIEHKMVRFRTLGCWPLTGAVESNATTVPEIIQEMLLTKTSERQGRVIDKDGGGAGMELKKIQGYF